MNNRPLTYPLQTGTLVTGLCFWLYTLFLVLMRAYLVSISGKAIVGEVIWLAATAGLLMMYCSMLAEYCLDIVLASAAGKPDSPTLLARYGLELLLGDRRFVRLLFVLGAFVTVAYQLAIIGYPLLAYGLLTYLAITLPAIMAANVLYQQLWPMLNPVSLISSIVQSSWQYLLALAWLAATLALWWLSLQLPFYFILLLLPPMLYTGFLCCHVTGTGIEHQYDLLFPPVNFAADREQLKVVSDELGTLNKQLGDFYEILLAGKHAQVSQHLMALLDAQHWGNFEQVYHYTSEWFDARPALYITSHFLDSAEAGRHPMRALALATWALQKHTEFTQHNPGALLQLAEHAATPAQFRLTLQLIRNHLQQYPHSPQLDALQRKALQLAAEKLNDEKLFHQLQTQYQSA